MDLPRPELLDWSILFFLVKLVSQGASICLLTKLMVTTELLYQVHCYEAWVETVS